MITCGSVVAVVDEVDEEVELEVELELVLEFVLLLEVLELLVLPEVVVVTWPPRA